jgi:hypothetical protein
VTPRADEPARIRCYRTQVSGYADEVTQELHRMEVRLSRAIEEGLAAPLREMIGLLRADDQALDARLSLLERQMADLARDRRGS